MMRSASLLAVALMCVSIHAQSPSSISSKSLSGPIRLKTYIVNDPQLGVEAFRFVMPAEWKAEGGIVWRANPSRPSTVSMRIFNPDGVEEMGIVPDIPCVWAATLAGFGFPVGSQYLGNEVRPPIPEATACLRTLILPRYASRLSGAAFESQESLPEMAKSWAAANYPGAIGAKFSGGKIRISVQAQNKPAEMDIYAVVGMFTIPINGVPMTYWAPDGIRYSRAQKGKLEEQYKLLQTVMSSETMNIQWLNLYTQVQAMMVKNQMEASNRAVELSRYLSQTNRQISATIRQSYEQRQAAMDRVHANFDRYVRGVDGYQYQGRTVELPSGYRNAWANENGEFVLSDNPNFNPNIGSTRGWHTLQKQH